MYDFTSTLQLQYALLCVGLSYKFTITFKFVVVTGQNVEKFKGYEYFFKALYLLQTNSVWSSCP